MVDNMVEEEVSEDILENDVNTRETKKALKEKIWKNFPNCFQTIDLILKITFNEIFG